MLRCSSTWKSLQGGENLGRKLAHAAGAERQNQVAFASAGGHDAYRDRELSREFDARSLNAFGETLRGHAGNRLLAGCVNRQDNYRVSVCECARKFVQKIKRSREPMR